jgi:hypothetical protein
MRLKQRREFFDRKDLVFHLKHTIFELSVIELLNAKQQWPALLQPRSLSNSDSVSNVSKLHFAGS